MDSHAWDERYGGRELVWSGTPNVFVAEIAGSLDPGSALDVAAGEGRNAVWLAEQGLAGHRRRLLAGRRGAGRPDRARAPR